MEEGERRKKKRKEQDVGEERRARERFWREPRNEDEEEIGRAHV